MPESDLLQQQRDILKAFRAASAARASAEAQANAQHTSVVADADQRCQVEHTAADAELARVRQAAAGHLTEVQKVHAETRSSLSRAGLAHLLETGATTPAAPDPTARPPDELARCVSGAERVRQRIEEELAALRLWQDAEAARHAAAAARRRLVLRVGLGVGLVLVAAIAWGAYQAARAWQKESLYQTASAALLVQQWQIARDALQQLAALDPNYKDAPTLLRQAIPNLGMTLREKDGAEMVQVPADEFTMGSPDGEGSDDEHPQHTVYLDAFWIDQTEVTNARYRRCVEAGACQASSYADNSDFNGDSQPVVGVDWSQATAYCQWAGARLPTEAEWEKAARGTDGRKYPWGDQDATCEYAVMDDGSGNGCGQGDRAWPVGSKPAGASPYGALDMAGNVWEWVADWYAADYYARSPERNPTGPDSGETRGLRGGAYSSDFDQINVRSAGRNMYNPHDWNYGNGFRCAAATSSL